MIGVRWRAAHAAALFLLFTAAATRAVVNWGPTDGPRCMRNSSEPSRFFGYDLSLSSGEDASGWTYLAASRPWDGAVFIYRAPTPAKTPINFYQVYPSNTTYTPPAYGNVAWTLFSIVKDTDNGTWPLHPQSMFGRSISQSSDGSLLVVGIPGRARAIYYGATMSDVPQSNTQASGWQYWPYHGVFRMYRRATQIFNLDSTIIPADQDNFEFNVNTAITTSNYASFQYYTFRSNSSNALTTLTTDSSTRGPVSVTIAGVCTPVFTVQTATADAPCSVSIVFTAHPGTTLEVYESAAILTVGAHTIYGGGFRLLSGGLSAVKVTTTVQPATLGLNMQFINRISYTDTSRTQTSVTTAGTAPQALLSYTNGIPLGFKSLRFRSSGSNTLTILLGRNQAYTSNTPLAGTCTYALSGAAADIPCRLTYRLQTSSATACNVSLQESAIDVTFTTTETSYRGIYERVNTNVVTSVTGYVLMAITFTVDVSYSNTTSLEFESTGSNFVVPNATSPVYVLGPPADLTGLVAGAFQASTEASSDQQIITATEVSNYDFIVPGRCSVNTTGVDMPYRGCNATLSVWTDANTVFSFQPGTFSVNSSGNVRPPLASSVTGLQVISGAIRDLRVNFEYESYTIMNMSDTAFGSANGDVFWHARPQAWDRFGYKVSVSQDPEATYVFVASNQGHHGVEMLNVFANPAVMQRWRPLDTTEQVPAVTYVDPWPGQTNVARLGIFVYKLNTLTGRYAPLQFIALRSTVPLGLTGVDFSVLGKNSTQLVLAMRDWQLYNDGNSPSGQVRILTVDSNTTLFVDADTLGNRDSSDSNWTQEDWFGKGIAITLDREYRRLLAVIGAPRNSSVVYSYFTDFEYLYSSFADVGTDPDQVYLSTSARSTTTARVSTTSSRSLTSTTTAAVPSNNASANTNDTLLSSSSLPPSTATPAPSLTTTATAPRPSVTGFVVGVEIPNEDLRPRSNFFGGTMVFSPNSEFLILADAAGKRGRGRVFVYRKKDKGVLLNLIPAFGLESVPIPRVEKDPYTFFKVAELSKQRIVVANASIPVDNGDSYANTTATPSPTSSNETAYNETASQSSTSSSVAATPSPTSSNASSTFTPVMIWEEEEDESYRTDWFGNSMAANWWVIVVGAAVDECIYSYPMPQMYVDPSVYIERPNTDNDDIDVDPPPGSEPTPTDVPTYDVCQDGNAWNFSLIEDLVRYYFVCQNITINLNDTDSNTTNITAGPRPSPTPGQSFTSSSDATLYALIAGAVAIALALPASYLIAREIHKRSITKRLEKELIAAMNMQQANTGAPIGAIGGGVGDSQPFDAATSDPSTNALHEASSINHLMATMYSTK